MLRELWFVTVRATSQLRNQFQGTSRLIFLKRPTMIKSAISNTVYTRLVTTTSIVAKLAVCAVLIAGAASCAQAAAAAAAAAGGASFTPRRATAHAISKAAANKPTARPSSLAKLERDWKRLHSRSQHAALDRLVACREYGRCEGLKIHPTLGAVLIRVSPERPSMGAAISAADRPRTAASGVYARSNVTARLRTKPNAAVRIRAAAADDGDQGVVSPPNSGAASVNP
jgi:hypothetical protein